MSQPNLVFITDENGKDTGEVYLNLDGVWSPSGVLPSFQGYNLVKMPKATYDAHVAAVLQRLANLKAYLAS